MVDEDPARERFSAMPNRRSVSSVPARSHPAVDRPRESSGWRRVRLGEGDRSAAPDLARAVPVSLCEHIGTLGERRRHALGEAVAEVAAAAAGSGRPALAVHVYGEGCVAVALAGEFDRAALEQLRDLTNVLPRLAPAELAVDLSHLESCPPALARALARLRMQRLVDGARVELHSVPAELAIEFGAAPAQAYQVVDDADAVRAGGRRDEAR